jgi:amidase
MAYSLETCKVFTKAVLDGRPWELDPLCLRKPWDQEAYELRDHGRGKEMCFAIMWDNEVVKPHPPVTRALHMVKTALENAGHKGDDNFPPWTYTTVDILSSHRMEAL